MNEPSANTAVRPAGPAVAALHSETVAPLRVAGLRKSFGSIHAVKDLSFDIQAGEVFGLLGPNGAGKTTTISVIATRLVPTAGDGLVFGYSVVRDRARVREMIGVVPQEIAIYPKLTAAENVRFFGRMYGVPKGELEQRIDELLELVGLDGRRNDLAETFSGGMKRRLNLAVSLVHRPRLLLLDEPTVGVDPHSRKHIFQIVEQLRGEGTAVLYTTHYMEEAEQLCDRLAIMDEGRIIAMGTLDVLLNHAGCAEIIEVRGLPSVDPLTRLQTAEGVTRVETHNGVTRIFVNRAAGVLALLHQAIGRYEDQVSVQIAPPSLETLFLQLTGKDLRD